MCGICGFLSKRGMTREQLKRMNDTMVHRGPNDSGEEIYPLKKGYTLGLAQRRLSILDLSDLGHQPMHSENGRLSIVYNGELYNFRELKKELSEYPFKSDCDTEVILAAYLRWGINCVSRFKGMFAFAVFDRETEELFLVRDPIGKKPLYYWRKNQDIVFASELKPIMKAEGFPRRLRTQVIQRFLAQQYINAPDTIFEDVFQLEPGGILCFSNGEARTWKYWDVKEVYARQKKNPVTNYEQAKGELKELLKNAVQKRMIADVPLGAFLSGGYDSSLMTAMAQEFSPGPVKTFSIGFGEEAYNEAGYAKEISRYLGTEHKELYIDEGDMFRMLEGLPRYFDEPFADSSQIPTMLVSELAGKDVTVALSGDGGDEFFCGYNVYGVLEQAQRLDCFGGLLHGITGLPGVKRLDLLRRLPYKVRTIAANRDPETKTQLGSEKYESVISKMVLTEGKPCKYPMESQYGEQQWQERRMLLDMDTYLPGDILCKVDRASMKYSLEARCPILDVDVMEYAYRLPHSFKCHRGEKKRILKDIAYDYIPREMLDRPKTGFSVPLDQWLRGPLRERLLAASRADFLKEQGIFDSDYLPAFVNYYLSTGDKGGGTGENFSRIIWAFYMFQAWYGEYCVGK